jgi:hypothetical protein
MVGNGIKAPACLDLYSCRRLPGRIVEDQAGALLGFNDYEMKLVARHDLVIPLGRPAPNARKYYCTAEILALAADRAWLDKATRVISKAVREKNSRSQGRTPAPRRFSSSAKTVAVMAAASEEGGRHE